RQIEDAPVCPSGPGRRRPPRTPREPGGCRPRRRRRIREPPRERHTRTDPGISEPFTPSDSMDLNALQRRVDAYISQFREGYFPPLVNLARLSEEVGELARELNHLHGPKKKKADEPEGEVAAELADVLFVVVVLANQHGIDLDEAIRKTLEKYEVRDADRWE